MTGGIGAGGPLVAAPLPVDVGADSAVGLLRLLRLDARRHDEVSDSCQAQPDRQGPHEAREPSVQLLFYRGDAFEATPSLGNPSSSEEPA